MGEDGLVGERLANGARLAGGSMMIGLIRIYGWVDTWVRRVAEGRIDR